jgi:hypothetical protein
MLLGVVVVFFLQLGVTAAVGGGDGEAVATFHRSSTDGCDLVGGVVAAGGGFLLHVLVVDPGLLLGGALVPTGLS